MTNDSELWSLLLSEKSTRERQHRHPPPYEPTLEEISEMTAEIRSGWSDKECLRRYKEFLPLKTYRLHVSRELIAGGE